MCKAGRPETGWKVGGERPHGMCDGQMVNGHVSVPPVDLSRTPDVEVVVTWHSFTLEVVGSRVGQLRTESQRERRPYVCACAHVRGHTRVQIGGGGSPDTG